MMAAMSVPGASFVPLLALSLTPHMIRYHYGDTSEVQDGAVARVATNRSAPFT